MHLTLGVVAISVDRYPPSGCVSSPAKVTSAGVNKLVDDVARLSASSA
jgi:hypothetical protein